MSLTETEELTNEAIAEMVRENKFVVLTTTDLGHRFRAATPCHILKLEAPEPDTSDYGWGHTQRLRIVLDCSPESMLRYSTDEEFQHIICKRITAEYNFPSISEWIHTQTKGRWSMRVLADVRRRPKHSFLMFSFEETEAAMFFKLFQI